MSMFAKSEVESKLPMGEAPRTVLIVDDDPQILRLVERMLKARAVNILMAPRASDALIICDRQSVDLLISDVSMPEMDGNKLADRVLKRFPDATALLMSGHYRTVPENSGRIRYLKKPFFPSELIGHLRELLP
jgi:DNA-binding NtrC family response regulator